MESAQHHSAAACDRAAPRAPTAGNGWRSGWIHQIEDFEASEPLPLLRSVALSAAEAPESVASFRSERMACWSARVARKLLLQGTCRPLRSTVFLALEAPNGNRCNYVDFSTGSVALFQPGDHYELCCHPNTLLVCIGVPQALLHTFGDTRYAAEDALLRSRGVLRADHAALDDSLGEMVRQLHLPLRSPSAPPAPLLNQLLHAAVAPICQTPTSLAATNCLAGHARILALARHYIDARLSEAITVSAVAAAALTSVRTLHRAFSELLGESMQHYVRVQRLHRIRKALLGDQPVTVTRVGSHWGINEFGRLSSWYRDLFGELPSETLLRKRVDRANGALRRRSFESGESLHTPATGTGLSNPPRSR